MIPAGRERQLKRVVDRFPVHHGGFHRHTEPDLPSIRTRLVHDTALATLASLEVGLPSQKRAPVRELLLDAHADSGRPQIGMATNAEANALSAASNHSDQNAADLDGAQTLHGDAIGRSDAMPVSAQQLERAARRWPRVRNDEPLPLTYEEGHGADHSIGLEP